MLPQVFSEVLEKNYRHVSDPAKDLVMDLDEKDATAAYDFYAKEAFESLEVANNAVLKAAWGMIDDDELKAVNIPGLETKDQEKLEAREAKEKNKLSAKRKRLDLQKIRREVNKKTQAKAGPGPSSSNPSIRPSTPTPPPPNQLQQVQDTDQTPKGESIF